MYTNMYTDIINYEEQNGTLTFIVKVQDDSSVVRIHKLLIKGN